MSVSLAAHRRTRPSRCSARSAISTKSVPSTARSASTRCCAFGGAAQSGLERRRRPQLPRPRSRFRPISKVGKLSVGQQAQVALTMCLAKRPALLLLDEPVAALDPVAREGLMHILLRSVVDDNTTVVLSSHAVSDLATICDYVIILSASRVYVADDLDYVLASHRLLMASSEQAPSLPPGVLVVSTRTANARRAYWSVSSSRSPIPHGG